MKHLNQLLAEAKGEMPSEHKRIARTVHKHLEGNESLSPSAGSWTKTNHRMLQNKYGPDWRKKAGLTEKSIVEAKKTKIETDPDVEDLYTHEVNELHVQESQEVLQQLESLQRLVFDRMETLGESVSLEEAAITTGIRDYVAEMYDHITSHETLAGYLKPTQPK